MTDLAEAPLGSLSFTPKTEDAPTTTSPAPLSPMSYEPPAGILVTPANITQVNEGDRIEEYLPDNFDDIEALGNVRSSAGLVPVGIVRAADPNSNYTFRQIYRVWIAPEIAKRVEEGRAAAEALPEVSQALIVFPPKSAPERHRVLLNQEVRPRATVRPAYPEVLGEAAVGRESQMSVRDMFDLRELVFDGVDMQLDGFAWLRAEAEGWALYFNFLPSSGVVSSMQETHRQQVMRGVQDAIAQELLRSFMRNVFTDDLTVRSNMATDGWCPTPMLLPDHWKRMCTAYQKGDAEGAAAVAIAAIGARELDTMLATWITEEPFASDRRFLELGLRHYKAEDYISAVSVLLPRIEGLANKVRTKRGLGARNSIAQVFAKLDELASADLRDGYLATRIREEFSGLITSFLMAHFLPSAPDADAARGRHAHAHGATGDPQYDQAYALKIILALDALYFISR